MELNSKLGTSGLILSMYRGAGVGEGRNGTNSLIQEVSETSTGTIWKTASSVFTQLAVFKRITGNTPASNLSETSKGQMTASPWRLRNLI